MNITSDVVLILIGAVFMLLSLIGSIKIKEVTSLDLPKWARVLVFILGVALIGFGISEKHEFYRKYAEQISTSDQKVVSQDIAIAGQNLNAINTTLSASNFSRDTIGVLFTKPSDRSIVTENGIEVTGVYGENVKEDLWVFVWPEEAKGRGWPQSDDAENGMPCAKRNDGTWLVYAWLGGPNQSYEIVVYTASSQATEFISTNLKSWFKSRDHKGITRPMLPVGLVERGRVTIRKST